MLTSAECDFIFAVLSPFSNRRSILEASDNLLSSFGTGLSKTNTQHSLRTRLAPTTMFFKLAPGKERPEQEMQEKARRLHTRHLLVCIVGTAFDHPRLRRTSSGENSCWNMPDSSGRRDRYLCGSADGASTGTAHDRGLCTVDSQTETKMLKELAHGGFASVACSGCGSITG